MQRDRAGRDRGPDKAARDAPLAPPLIGWSLKAWCRRVDGGIRRLIQGHDSQIVSLRGCCPGIHRLQCSTMEKGCRRVRCQCDQAKANAHSGEVALRLSLRAPRFRPQRYVRPLQDRAIIRQDQASRAKRHRQILLHRGVAETPNGRSVFRRERPPWSGHHENLQAASSDEF